MNRNFLGIDIRPNGLYAVLLKYGFKKSFVEDYAYIPLEGLSNHPESLAAALETLSGKMDIIGSSCIVSIFSNAFSFRNVVVPFHHPKKILQVLPYELEASLPVSPMELVIDFQKITWPLDEENVHIIATAARLDWVKAYLDQLEAAGLHMEGIVPAGYPLSTYFGKHIETSNSFLLIELCETLCTFVIVNSGEVTLLRTIPVDADISNLTATVTTHLQRTMAGFEALYRTAPDVQRIFLSGSGFMEEPLVRNVQQSLQRVYAPVQIADIVSVKNLLLPTTDKGDGAWQPALFSSALSSALIAAEGHGSGINFRKGPLAPKGGFGEYRDGIIKFAIAAGCVLLLFLVTLIMETSGLEKRSDRLQDEMVAVYRSTFPDATKIIKTAVLEQMRTRIRELKKTAPMPSTLDMEMRVTDILNNISNGIPASMNVKFSKLVIGDQGILISGDTDSFNSVDELKNRLEKLESFSTVKITSANMDNASNRVRFKLKIQ